MRNYTADDIAAMFKQYEQHVQYVIVAHTHHRPYAACRHKSTNVDTWLMHKQEQTSKDLRYALNCFNSLLYPNATNAARRKPMLYRPLSFVTIEGAKQTLDRQQTIHVNIAIGNIPIILNRQDIETLFRHVWQDKARQGNDIEVIDYYKAEQGRGWAGYSLKEAKHQPSRAWNENSIWDVENCWIPHNAINVD